VIVLTSLNWSDPGNLRERNVRTVGEFFARLEAMDIDGFVGLWAEEGVQEMPFAPEGFPGRLEGRDALRRQYGGLPDAYERMAFDVAVHPMAEPNLVVAEYRGSIELMGGGTYNNRYVGIFRFAENGEISSFTEYFDPIGGSSRPTPRPSPPVPRRTAHYEVRPRTPTEQTVVLPRESPLAPTEPPLWLSASFPLQAGWTHRSLYTHNATLAIGSLTCQGLAEHPYVVHGVFPLGWKIDLSTSNLFLHNAHQLGGSARGLSGWPL
jgi:uncharacterized protein